MDTPNKTKAQEEREKALQELIESGQYGVMTESAYGGTIASMETDKKVKESKAKETK